MLLLDAELSRKERGHRGVRPCHPNRQTFGSVGSGFLKRPGAASFLFVCKPEGTSRPPAWRRRRRPSLRCAIRDGRPATLSRWCVSATPARLAVGAACAGWRRLPSSSSCPALRSSLRAQLRLGVLPEQFAYQDGVFAHPTANRHNIRIERCKGRSTLLRGPSEPAAQPGGVRPSQPRSFGLGAGLLTWDTAHNAAGAEMNEQSNATERSAATGSPPAGAERGSCPRCRSYRFLDRYENRQSGRGDLRPDRRDLIRLRRLCELCGCAGACTARVGL
jgi:hypothetical protein